MNKQPVIIILIIVAAALILQTYAEKGSAFSGFASIADCPACVKLHVCTPIVTIPYNPPGEGEATTST